MFHADDVRRLIEEALPCEFIVIEGDDGVHFSGIVVSATFAGKPRVRQHQMVYAALGDLIGGEIHALQLQTYTPETWAVVRAAMDAA
jgi:acid stress-induced BolA-like protein IbaG/YrbA